MYRRLSLVLALAIVGCHPAPPRHSTTVAATQPASRPATLQAELTEILNRHANTGAYVAARIVDPETGEELFAQDATKPMTPASNMKLTVMTAAIDFFGTDAEFETDLALAGDDLHLIGHGDPGTGDDQIAEKHGETTIAPLDRWANELLAKKVTHINNLYYYDGAFEPTQTHPTWKGDLNEWYAAPIGGLNFNDNCVDAECVPSQTEGQPPAVTLIPETSSTLVLVNHATSGGENEIDWERDQTQNVFTITGTIAKVTKLQSKPVTDPGWFFADALRTHLAKKGIKITGQILHGDTPPTEMTKLAPAKTKFTDILPRIGKNSQNLLAEGTAKKLGLEFEARRTGGKAVGSWANAESAIRDFWQREQIDGAGYVFADGSGLSRDNRVTTKLISDLLVKTYHKPYFETFRTSLTIAGVDGTTKDRLKDAKNRVFAKTGFISGVRALSGYVKTDSGKWLVFSIIYNGITPRGGAATKPYEALQDETLMLLMKR